MSIISFIDDSEIIRNPAFSGIKHLGLWDVKRKPPPRANGPTDDPASLMKLRRTAYLMDGLHPMDLSRRSSTCWVAAESEA